MHSSIHNEYIQNEAVFIEVLTYALKITCNWFYFLSQWKIPKFHFSADLI